mgnify:CR=1 FL=1
MSINDVLLACVAGAIGEHLRVTIVATGLGGVAAQPAPTASRRFRVNGIARRASDLIGRLRTVLFSADDLALIDGPPAGRRRSCTSK